MVDVTNQYSVGSVRRMFLSGVRKHEPAEAPEDNFFAKFTVSDGKVILERGSTELDTDTSEESEDFTESQLLKKTKKELAALILS
jgi:hypothetical protein